MYSIISSYLCLIFVVCLHSCVDAARDKKKKKRIASVHNKEEEEKRNKQKTPLLWSRKSRIFIRLFAKKRRERDKKKSKSRAFERLWLVSHSLSRERETPHQRMHTYFSRAKSPSFVSRSLRVVLRFYKVVKKIKRLSPNAITILSEKLVDCVQNPQQKRDTKNKTKKKSFPKSTLAKHHATVRAPLRLFGQFRLEHEIVPLHFLYIYMFELI